MEDKWRLVSGGGGETCGGGNRFMPTLPYRECRKGGKKKGCDWCRKEDGYKSCDWCMKGGTRVVIGAEEVGEEK